MSTPRTLPISDIPRKIYYSISEVSEYTGVEPYVLRYWETKFTKLAPTRVGGNQRKYTRQDLELLYTIVRLLYEEGYTLEGAERKLRKGWPPAKKVIAPPPSGLPTPTAPTTSVSVTETGMKKELLAIKDQLEELIEMMETKATFSHP